MDKIAIAVHDVLEYLAGGMSVDEMLQEFSGFTIVSKDSDFRQLSFVRGGRPKVFWVRIGDCNVSELREIFRTHTEQLRQFDEAIETFLVIEPHPAQDRFSGTPG